MAAIEARDGLALNVEVGRVAASDLGLFFCKLPLTGQSSAVPLKHRPGYKVGCRFLQPVAATRRGRPGRLRPHPPGPALPPAQPRSRHQHSRHPLPRTPGEPSGQHDQFLHQGLDAPALAVVVQIPGAAPSGERADDRGPPAKGAASGVRLQPIEAVLKARQKRCDTKRARERRRRCEHGAMMQPSASRREPRRRRADGLPPHAAQRPPFAFGPTTPPRTPSGVRAR